MDTHSLRSLCKQRLPQFLELVVREFNLCSDKRRYWSRTSGTPRTCACEKTLSRAPFNTARRHRERARPDGELTWTPGGSSALNASCNKWQCDVQKQKSGNNRYAAPLSPKNATVLIQGQHNITRTTVVTRVHAATRHTKEKRKTKLRPKQHSLAYRRPGTKPSHSASTGNNTLHTRTSASRRLRSSSARSASSRCRASSSCFCCASASACS